MLRNDAVWNTTWSTYFFLLIKGIFDSLAVDKIALNIKNQTENVSISIKGEAASLEFKMMFGKLHHKSNAKFFLNVKIKTLV